MAVIVVPSFWVSAEMPYGHVQLSVSRDDLDTLLAILNRNHAVSVSYARVPRGKDMMENMLGMPSMLRADRQHDAHQDMTA